MGPPSPPGIPCCCILPGAMPPAWPPPGRPPPGTPPGIPPGPPPIFPEVRLGPARTIDPMCPWDTVYSVHAAGPVISPMAERMRVARASRRIRKSPAKAKPRAPMRPIMRIAHLSQVSHWERPARLKSQNAVKAIRIGVTILAQSLSRAIHRLNAPMATIAARAGARATV